MTLVEAAQRQLAESIQRQATRTASRWGERYIILGKPLPGPMRFGLHPWEREWCDYPKDWSGKKGAQMGMTNACLIRSLFNIDILRNDVLYVLPKKNPDAADFSKTKFDVLLDPSPYLTNLFNNVRNVGHKQAGGVNFYLRGSRSRSALKSISVGLKIFDEFDEMNQKNVPLAEERSAGYQEEDTQTIKISTPTLPDFGITKEYATSTQDHFFFKCPFCSFEGKPRWTEFLGVESIVIPTDSAEDRAGLKQSYLTTGCCKHRLPDAKALYLNEKTCKWMSTANGDVRGFWIPQLYSFVKPLWKMARQVIRARTDQIEEQELYNSVLAKEFVAEGARVQEEQVRACQHNHTNRSTPRSPIVTMGVDVGHKELFCHIDEWLLPENISSGINTAAIPVSRGIVTVPSFADLDYLMEQYQILHTVIDVDPAYRDAINFCSRFPGRSNLCRFVRGIKKREVQTEDSENLVLQVNRTTWLDQSQSRYMVGHRGIILPRDLPDGYTKMIMALIKRTEKDKDGNLTSRYVSTGADHWAFARVYSEIALPFAVSTRQGQDVKLFL